MEPSEDARLRRTEQQITSAQEANLCGSCQEEWPLCECLDTARTESMESLLSNQQIFPDANNRHLCVFAYQSYQRWSAAAADEAEFSPACTPPWEGWYPGWLKPSNGQTVRVGWSEKEVLPITLQYVNGAAAEGFVDWTGRMFVHVAGPPPPGGVDYDHDRRLLRAEVQLSQALTLDEIESGVRGIVHSSTGVPNGGRKVSHVVREEKNAGVVVCTLPRTPGAMRETAFAATDRMKRVAPFLYEEVRWRTRRRFTKKAGEKVQVYLRVLFDRARLGDDAARYVNARGWRKVQADPTVMLNLIQEQLGALAGVQGGAGSAARGSETPPDGLRVGGRDV